ncbi:hypothetical protein, partial [Halobacillus sp. BBL2006]|uniref:hypothetical protein n=1 Tax=Halobacillus sp. BBL2006 TaxID=1543706 RepID=UPI000542E778
MIRNRVITPDEFEEQLFQLKEKFTLMEKRLSLKADEIVFTMAISHRKEIDELKEEVFQLRDQLKQVKKEQKNHYL